MKTKLKIKLLAEGQIGDIIAYSDFDKKYVNSCIEAARKIKFIPAQTDGKNIDAFVIEDYSFTVVNFAGF
ncbi:MAG TPA: hypothetical protein VGC76_15440 [Pyrinomonadaceae bacterium]|jgi:hypothetical protein